MKSASHRRLALTEIPAKAHTPLTVERRQRHSVYTLLKNTRQKLIHSRDEHITQIYDLMRAAGLETAAIPPAGTIPEPPQLRGKATDNLPPALSQLLSNLQFLCNELSRQIFEIDGQLQQQNTIRTFFSTRISAKAPPSHKEASAQTPASSNLYYLADFDPHSKPSRRKL